MRERACTLVCAAGLSRASRPSVCRARLPRAPPRRRRRARPRTRSRHARAYARARAYPRRCRAAGARGCSRPQRRVRPGTHACMRSACASACASACEAYGARIHRGYTVGTACSSRACRRRVCATGTAPPTARPRLPQGGNRRPRARMERGRESRYMTVRWGPRASVESSAPSVVRARARARVSVCLSVLVCVCARVRARVCLFVCARSRAHDCVCARARVCVSVLAGRV
jgi:hypothetical protein